MEKLQNATKTKISELQMIMSKMPLEVCCVTALPELGVRWREVARAVRNARLPMTPASVARVICRHVVKHLPPDDLADIVARLRLKLIATQSRMWHVIKLLEPVSDEPVNVLSRALPSRVSQVLRNTKSGRNMMPEVQTVKLGDLLYISVQLKSDFRESPPLYVATPPGEALALVSSVGSGMLKATVQALGYKKFEDACLHGTDVPSLLRITNEQYTDLPDHLTSPPEYQPTPKVCPTGVDYTSREYDDRYVDMVLGCDPPLLNHLTVKSVRPFFDQSRLNKKMNLTIQLKSENVAKTLKSWVVKGALAPTSDLFQIFHKIKSNKINYNAEDDE